MNGKFSLEIQSGPGLKRIYAIDLHSRGEKVVTKLSLDLGII